MPDQCGIEFDDKTDIFDLVRLEQDIEMPVKFVCDIAASEFFDCLRDFGSRGTVMLPIEEFPLSRQKIVVVNDFQCIGTVFVEVSYLFLT